VVVVVLAGHAHEVDEATGAPAVRMRGRLGGFRQVRR
jgi:hypothetical protein